MALIQEATAPPNPAPAEARLGEVEFEGRHLDAANAIRAAYHKKRLLEAIGATDYLPPLPRGNVGLEYKASETRFRHLADILHRDEPLEIPPVSAGISRDFIIALADNLAWRGVENSAVTTHLEVIKGILPRLRNHQTGRPATGPKKDSPDLNFSDLKSRERSLKAIAIADNHFYRNFFDSGLAADFGLDSPRAMKKFLKRCSLTGNGDDSIVSLARGMSLEIATKRFLSNTLARNEPLTSKEKAFVDFGYAEEDRRGGDIVVRRGQSTLYIDVKSKPPGGLATEEQEQGFKLNNERGTAKAIVWPESMEAVADDSFRLTDPYMKFALQNLLVLTR